MPNGTGRFINVSAGGDLQAAINSASLGDVIILQAGATYTGNYTLPVKTGSGWVVIRSSGTLPSSGTRIRPSDANQLAKIVAADPQFPAIQTALAAHNYRLTGLEITVGASASQGYSLVTIGDGSSAQDSMNKVAHDIILDHVYVHGTSTYNFQRCIALNSGSTAIVDSYISDCHGKDFDSQAIAGWNGPGPYRIENNFLEAAGENVMFGGATAAIQGLDPSDIVLRRNYFYKPVSWKGVWEVKNSLELKHARRVLIEGNVFENNWVDAQAGFAILWSSSAALTGASWTLTSDITFRYNIVRNTPSGINVAAAPDGPAQPARRVLIADNQLENISGTMFQMLGALQDVEISHNTAVFNAPGGMLVSFGGPTMSGFGFHGNIATLGTYGIKASGTASGVSALSHSAPGSYSVTGNVFVGQEWGDPYPTGNSLVASLTTIGFTDMNSANFTLSPASPYVGSGADIAAISTATAGVAINP